MAGRILVLFFVFLAAGPLWPQAGSAFERNEEPLSFVGMKLDELYRRFGSPQSVYTARGAENWQDDVVFVYNEGEFYIYQDRVWQIKIASFYNMKVGDAKGVALLVLGDAAQDRGDFALYSRPDGAWPISIRVNFDSGRISSIFVYRPDF